MEPLPTLGVDVSDLPADGAALDALARLALALQRCGYRLRLRHASPELLGLIELAGLGQTLTLDSTEPSG
jgi:hypothetical protein